MISFLFICLFYSTYPEFNLILDKISTLLICGMSLICDSDLWRPAVEVGNSSPDGVCLLLNGTGWSNGEPVNGITARTLAECPEIFSFVPDIELELIKIATNLLKSKIRQPDKLFFAGFTC